MALGRKTGGGSRKGKPNKNTALVKDMVAQALEEAGGIEYLKAQAEASPSAFLTLIGKLIPVQHTGAEGGPIIIATGVPVAADD